MNVQLEHASMRLRNMVSLEMQQPNVIPTIENATLEIRRHFKRHARYRAVQVAMANTKISLTGNVLVRRHSRQASEVACSWWSDILNHIEVSFLAFFLFHLLADLVIFTVAFRSEPLWPDTKWHAAFLFVLMGGLFLDLSWEICEELADKRHHNQ
jgi:hypothetical protein